MPNKHERMRDEDLREAKKQTCKFKLGSTVTYNDKQEKVESIGNFESGAAFVWLSESGPVYATACEYGFKS